MYDNRELNQEQTAAENLLYQRLIMFLIVFSVLVIGAVNTQRKILFLSILFLGVLICWVLTFIIIRTAKRIDNKSGGKFVRIMLGYFVPIFCSCLLTVVLFVGSFGFADSYLFSTDLKPVQVGSKIDEVKNDLVKSITPAEKKTSNNFKNIDSVIAEGKTVYSSDRTGNTNAGSSPVKTAVSKQNINSKYFKSIDSVIVNDKPVKSKTRLNGNQITQPIPATSKQLQGLKNIDSVTAKKK